MYRLNIVEQNTAPDGTWTLTLAAEHAAGLERFVFRCRIAAPLLQKGTITDPQAACASLARWLEGQFEQVRETSLKAIRSEHRLSEFAFDALQPGPFQSH